MSEQRAFEKIVHMVGGCQVVRPKAPEGIKVFEVTINPDSQCEFKILEDKGKNHNQNLILHKDYYLRCFFRAPAVVKPYVPNMYDVVMTSPYPMS